MKRLSHTLFTKLAVIAAFFFISPSVLLAADAPKKSSMDNPMVVVLVIIISALLVIIAMLGYVLSGTAQFYVKQRKESQGEEKIVSKILSIAALVLFSASAFGQDSNAAVMIKDRSVAGISESTFFLLMSVIALEVIIILSLLYFLKRLLAKEEVVLAQSVEVAPKENRLQKWWERANRFRSIKEEADIDLGHDYDSIRELDNRLPPWWLYGFYCTVIFAIIYIWRAEVSHTSASSLQEYAAAVKEAEREKEIYLANAANNVDETTVKMLDADGISSGKAIFTSTCAPCHGPDGGGVVGPNLTDDYWLHGGSLKDIFKTIKYGVQEKGMKSWKDDLSPVQIAQISSFIKSIHGTKTANPKDPQGELIKEASDSSQKMIAVTQ